MEAWWRSPFAGRRHGAERRSPEAKGGPMDATALLLAISALLAIQVIDRLTR
jgi:hypothetical protein